MDDMFGSYTQTSNNRTFASHMASVTEDRLSNGYSNLIQKLDLFAVVVIFADIYDDGIRCCANKAE